jgi:SEC-C motif
MGHDEHFLERLDRVPRQHVELALGLYRDHELVRAILLDARLPATADRVALALEDSGAGPHVIVARDGGFVTCLGQGMSTGALPIVSRAHLDGLATRVERVREGLALARRRGLDEAKLLGRLESGGPAVSREDFLGAAAMVGPAVPLLMGMYTSWVGALDEMYPLLFTSRSWDAARRRDSERSLMRGAWAMAHSAMVLVDAASREWVRDWATLPGHLDLSPWTFLTMTSAFPFVVRSAWLAGRLGKPMFGPYKTRFDKAINSIDLREAGWGIACMGLRHASLRSEAMRALKSPPPHDGRDAWVGEGYRFFDEIARILEAKEEVLRAEGLALGRDFVVVRTDGLPEGSRFRHTARDQVPEDLALPGLFDAWHDANNGERAGDLMLLGVVAASRARAQDFYFPAAMIHAIGPPDLENMGADMVRMRRKLVGVPQTIVRGDRPGRNEPCRCGSGKKFKKCHGA